jgi:peptide/nickel transport system substrate-binding protein
MLAGCGQATVSERPAAPHRGGTLTVLWSGDVDSIDPGQTYYTGGYMVTTATQRTPLAFVPGRTTPQPDLAAAAPTVSADGRTVTLRLRPGVRFSAPVLRPVTSADVKYAIERGFFKTVANAYAPTYFGDLVGARLGAAPGTRIRGIETPDAHTVVFRLRKPTGATLAGALVLPLAAPVPREYALPFDRHNTSTYGPHQVATGPYRLAAYRPGVRIALVRNPQWRAATDSQPAYPDRIEMREGNSDATLAARRVLTGSHMLSGDFNAPPAMLRRTLAQRPGQIRLVDSGGGRWAALNTAIAPFNDLNVRRAVVAAFDRRAALLAVGGRAMGQVATHFLPPGTPGFAEAGGAAGPGGDFLAHPEGDLALARTYLRRAGYASGRYSGPPVLLVGGSDDTGRKLAAIEQSTLERLGFKVTVRLFAPPVAMGRFCSVPAARVNVCASVGWTRDFPDGETVLAPTFAGASIQPSGTPNMSQLRVPAVDAAIARAATTAAPAARARAWGEVDRAVTALAPAVPLVWDKTSLLHSADVRAVVNDGLGIWDVRATSVR